jgi:CMP-N,N'-diacetyllegionaminic acid synthase
MSKYVVDIDGVVAAPVEGLKYDRAMPIMENIEKFNKLYDEGHEIIYFTARGSETGKDWEMTTLLQFRQWGVKFTDLKFGKPAADFYVDDKFIPIEEI